MHAECIYTYISTYRTFACLIARVIRHRTIVECIPFLGTHFRHFTLLILTRDATLRVHTGHLTMRKQFSLSKHIHTTRMHINGYAMSSSPLEISPNWRQNRFYMRHKLTRERTFRLEKQYKRTRHKNLEKNSRRLHTISNHRARAPRLAAKALFTVRVHVQATPRR